MIYCLNCGKGIPDQSKFCTFCGAAIKPADQPDSSTSPAQEYTPPPQQQQQYVNTPPQQPVNPVPPAQQYTPPPQQQQYVPPQQQYVNPAPQYVHPQPIATTKNEFYKNAGFWGAVLILASAFLPWVIISGYIWSFDGFTLVDLFNLGFNTSATSDAETGVIVWEVVLIIILVCALIIALDSFGNFLSKGLSKFFKLFPFILTVLMILFLFIGLKDKLDSDQFTERMQSVGIGVWAMVVGVILLLFYKKPKKVITV